MYPYYELERLLARLPGVIFTLQLYSYSEFEDIYPSELAQTGNAKSKN
jgi:hypothetical protein